MSHGVAYSREEDGEEGTCCTDYPHFSCAQACVRAAQHGAKNHHRRDRETRPPELKCHAAKSKGQVRLERVAPYQSAVVFAVLVGQVGNGGRDAGAEEQLPLVQVALVDFVQQLVVSAEGALSLLGHEKQRGVWSCCVLFLPPLVEAVTYSGIFSARCSICSIKDWKRWRGSFF